MAANSLTTGGLLMTATVITVFAVATAGLPAPDGYVKHVRQRTLSTSLDYTEEINGRVSHFDPERLSIAFDQTKVPKPQEPIPAASDPKAALQAYRLIGVILSDNERLALLAQGEQKLIVRCGEIIAGFNIVEIRPKQIILEQEKEFTSIKLEKP